MSAVGHAWSGLCTINRVAVAYPKGVVGGDWVHDGPLVVPFLSVRQRKGPVQHVVLHESAGGVNGFRTVASLAQRWFGVHFVVHPDGVVTCHADPAIYTLIHANQCNGTSVGVEVINPYYGSRAKPPFGPKIEAPWWCHCLPHEERTYCLPTPSQCATLRAFVPWLAQKVGVPVAFPTADLDEVHPRIEGWDRVPKSKRARPAPGIVSHRDFAGHADGRYPLQVVSQKFDVFG